MPTVKQTIVKAERIELSDDDLNDLTRGKCNILTYEDLEKYNTIDEVLGEHKCAIILFQSTEITGHWTTIFTSHQNPNELIFYDPYGWSIDSELKYSKYNLRIHNGQEVPHLSHLIEQSNYKVVSNPNQYQSNSKDINTCGRHVAVRVVFRKMSRNQYKHFILNSFEGMNPDQTVSMLTLLFSHPD